MSEKCRIRRQRKPALLLLALPALLLPARAALAAGSLAFPAPTWGICFGNAPRFDGLRFNVADKGLELVNGVNVTFWKASDKKAGGTVNGLSLGVLPFAGKLNGVQVGLLGPGAGKDVSGITLGLLGAGCGGDMTGLNVGGVGLGAGGSLRGINVASLGLGAGADVWGINIAGLGLGAGDDLVGLNVAGLGLGAGKKAAGVTVAGLGAGAGDRMVGLTVCGLGAGAPVLEGLTIAGLGVGGKHVRGAALALGTVRVVQDGSFNGLAVSAFNHIQGTMKGVAVGIVNYAYRLKGLQIGLLNIVRDNPRGRSVLPIVNFNF